MRDHEICSDGGRTGAGLVGAVFVSITHRDSDRRLSCVADIVLLVALLVALLVLCAALLAWEVAWL